MDTLVSPSGSKTRFKLWTPAPLSHSKKYIRQLHAATSLAEDLGLDLVDIYGIRKWIQMRASPLNDPDIVAEMTLVQRL
ncbi:hypothetical protein GLOIN_2v1779779 [Rhizophagus irregularis DAOM 181602=DAOM 197198]|uniref:Uncharacterized protein n=1 Tax=Rhizophagus irregularis (strain DAOM 197198w) TaxID=1432141 RepID=A0A015IP55_RHIIW|nr:hypothetical protein RirG_192790 [Rhizophagus irregularis DAOM 197198w]GBC47276.2 hypothetical protein GLOIN_2v1779779 [Rhizophagus irregularis DAOM 181602=DAOM 197198]